MFSRRLEPINSEELKDKFSSLRVELPEDPHRKSFARKLIIGLIEDLKTEVKSLSRGIVLTNSNDQLDDLDDVQPVHMYEVDVAYGKDGLNVHLKDPVEHTFFGSMTNSLPKVILVHSESMQVVDAKLKVYKTFKSYLEQTQIFLHHEYEDFDDIAKWIASQKIASLSAYVQSTIDLFSREHLSLVIENALKNSLTQENIRDLCCYVVIKTGYVTVGSVSSESYACRLTFTIQRLKGTLVDETLKQTAKLLGTNICNGILDHIETVVQSKLTEELRKLGFQITDEIQARIEGSITYIIFEIIHSVAGVIMSIGAFFITLIYPVDINSREWRQKIADEIFEKIDGNRLSLSTHILEEIMGICSKTVDDLKNILNQLTTHETKTFSIDQKKLIADWMEKENFARHRSKLEKHQSFLQYIAGHNDEGQIVVKVFLRGKKPIENVNPDLEKFRKCFDTTKEFLLDLVYIDTKPEGIMQNVNEIRKLENNISVFDPSTKTSLKKTIQGHEDKIYARYSAVIGIGFSQVRSVGKTMQIEPCIVLYCLDKTLIPFGEKQLPKNLEMWPCDIREDFVMFGHCPTACPASHGNLPEPGCSIGIAEVYSTGSVGFLVEFNNECGFLTASHVVVRNYETLYREEITFPNTQHQNNHDVIVHPSTEDCEGVNLDVGQVVQSFFGNYESRALDLALVKCNSSRKEDKRRLTAIGFDDLNTNEKLKVRKTGRTTGRTDGYLKDTIPSVRVKHFKFQNCYHVVNIDDTIFFKEGDSGSGVFLIQDEEITKPVGIAFAFMNYSPHTFVCRIDTIIDKLCLNLVTYSNENKSHTNFSQNQCVSVPMECSN